jgi:hypothetical protein
VAIDRNLSDHKHFSKRLASFRMANVCLEFDQEELAQRIDSLQK